MNDKLFTFLFNTVNSQVALILTQYPNEEDLINDWYESFIKDVNEDPGAYKTLLDDLIGLLEAKYEDYERCGVLLKIKRKII